MDKEKIFSLLNFVVNCSEIEWKEKIDCYKSKLMKYDYKNTIFKNFLKEYEILLNEKDLVKIKSIRKAEKYRYNGYSFKILFINNLFSRVYYCTCIIGTSKVI